MNEVKMIRENQIIYTYLHLAAAKELTEGLIKTKSICIACLLYTSDAADDLTRVDLGGRRIIKNVSCTTSYFSTSFYILIIFKTSFKASIIFN